MVAIVQKKASKHGFWSQLGQLPRAWVGAFMVGFMILGATLIPLLVQLDPLRQFPDGVSVTGTPLPPSSIFPFGTDHLGRDLFSRLIYGGRISLFISLAANLSAAVFGTAIGIIAGYYGDVIDTILMRVTDVILAYPAVLLALGLGAVLRPSIPVVILILMLVTWPALARLVRSQTFSVRERQFVESARASGATDTYIMFRHILPHVITVSVVWFTLSIASTILIESALSFLGVGVPLPTASWGNMILEGQSRYRIAPWMILLPTSAILITTLGFNLLGDAVRDALDPRTSLRL